MSQTPTKPRLLLICVEPTSFVQDDISLLSEVYEVEVFRFGAAGSGSGVGKALSLFARFLQQFFWLLRRLPDAELVYGWFIDYHVALPTWLGRVFRKPVVVAVAGFDAMRIPGLRYGVYFSRWRAPLARYVSRKATMLLPCSESMIRHSNRYTAYPDTLENGIAHHVSGFDTPYRVIPFGYDLESWPMGPPERERIVCTVGFMDRDRTFRRKGVDVLIEAARLLEDVVFQIVGVPESETARIRAEYEPSPNVHLLPPRPRSELAELYGRASVYAQVSRAEGMPNVLSEAMCCGCIPVGSAVFGIPDVIGDAGFIVEYPEPERVARAIREALALPPERRLEARERIARHFTTEHRRQLLREALAGLRASR